MGLRLFGCVCGQFHSPGAGMAMPGERVTVPIPSQPIRGGPSSARARTRAPASASRKIPSGPTNLSAFHSIGLWLAVIASPPAA